MFLAGPDAPDMDSADVVSLFSDEYTSPLNGVIGWGDGVITEMDVNGNTVKKFDSSVWNIFDVPTDVSSGSAETLSISLFRTMSSDFEIKLVDTTNGGGTGFYYIPAAQMPVNQWVTVDIPMSSFRGNDSMTGGPIAADLNIDQLVVKPMNNFDPMLMVRERPSTWTTCTSLVRVLVWVRIRVLVRTQVERATTYDTVTLDFETWLPT